MIIRRLDVFFRTQLILDQPQFFNTVTNLALAPLQHLIGQNQFQSLKGKVALAPQTTAVPPRYFSTLYKVAIVVGAFFLAIILTPIGIATRYMSFLSFEIEVAYFYAYLLQLEPFERTPEVMESAFTFIQKLNDSAAAKMLYNLPTDIALSFFSLPAFFVSTSTFLSQLPLPNRAELLKILPPPIQVKYLSLVQNAEFACEYLTNITEAEYTPLMPHLPIRLIEFYQDQKVKKDKKESLDNYLTTAIRSLEKLEALKSKRLGPLEEYRNDVFYPFPFYLAGQLESDPKIIARADGSLWKRFMTLRQSCLAFLPSDCDEALLQTTQTQARAILTNSFNSNIDFFKELRGKLESNMETSEIKDWIEEQKRAPNYSYPFYTQPGILKLLGQTAAAEKLQPFSDTLSISLNLLRQRGLEEYISEKHHVTVNTLMQAMDQLENIFKLQKLIKTQTA